MDTGVVPTTSFVGRASETHALLRALDVSPIVTVIGPGGCGKTRLVLEARASLVEQHPGGVWFVRLASLSDPELVVGAVMTAAGLREDPSRTLDQTLRDGVEGPGTLLVLDSCEHLIAEAGRVASLVATAGGSVLATSRQCLGLAEETVIALGPLPSAADAMRLFRDRAEAARPGFALSDANEAAVQALCERLDRLPLAIELAAARTNVLSPAQILERIGDRFGVLASAPTDSTHQHRTLREAIRWSYELLGPGERELFADLSVFAGTFSIDAAETVSGSEDVLNCLGSLIDRSLVVAEDLGASTRYRLLESLRDFAREQLEQMDRTDGTERRHAVHYREVARRIEIGLNARDEADRLDPLPEMDDCRVALDRMLVRDPDLGAQIAEHLWWFWLVSGRLVEGSQRLDAVIRSASRPGKTLANVLNGAANIATESGDYATAKRLYERCLEMRLELGHRREAARTMTDMGIAAQRFGDPEGALASYGSAWDLRDEMESPGELAHILLNLGALHLSLEQVEEARGKLQEALVHATEAGDRLLCAAALGNLGTVSRLEGRFADARGQLGEALRALRDLGMPGVVVQGLDALIDVLDADGDLPRAVTLRAAVEATRADLGIPRPPAEATTQADALRARMNAATFERAWARGTAMTWTQAVAFALDEDIEQTRGTGELARDGTVWRFTFGQRTVHLGDSRGIGYLALLLAHPNREFHCLELVTGSGDGPRTNGEADILDDAARKAYRARIVHLRQELAEADRWGDAVASQRAQDEIDAISRELTAALGLGGKPRQLGSDAERARKAVTNRIKAAMRKIAHEHPEAGLHLQDSVRTGTFCVYGPEEAVSWWVSDGGS